MKSLCSPFYYDVVLSLNSNPNLYNIYKEYFQQHPNQKFLAVTYNHRLFHLNEKNFMKALIDEFNLDHLMFSIKPSSVWLINQTNGIRMEEFRSIAQLVFTLQAMARYDISSAIASSKFLDMNGTVSTDAISVYGKIETYFETFKANFKNKELNVDKAFCSLFSLLELKEKLVDKIIFFEESISISEEYKKEQFIYEKQISELEKDLFWIGFDPSFKEVPWDKTYEITKWNTTVKESPFGTALYENKLQYCNRCCMPETMEGITFDEFGICTPCRSSEEKMHINWEERELKLTTLISNNLSDYYYDCMLPMSGGKDSMFQAYILTQKYDVIPLAVTHGANWLSYSGRYNLENCLQKFDLDHIIFHANRATINKAARKSLSAIGDACWHCHIGAGTFVIQTALAWNIGLLIWGESIAERDGRGSYMNQTEASLYYNLEVSGKVKAEDFADENIPQSELSHWFYPNQDKLKESNIRYLHLGDYIFWDEEKQVDFIVRNFEWMDSKVENAFKGYKSNECVMAGVHDYANFIKRGIGRATVQASDDIRRGLITREEGIQLAKEYDSQRPHALDFYLKLTGYSEKEFEDILVEARAVSEYAKKMNDISND